MNIRQRITLFVILTFIAISLIGGFAVVRSRDSSTEVKTVTEGVVPSAIASVELMNQLKDVQIATLAMVAATEIESVKTAQTELAAKKSVLQQALDKQYAMADNDVQRGLLKQTVESLVNYFEAIDETAKFKLAGQKELAEANLSANVDQYLREQGSIIETVQIEKRRSKDEAILTLNQNLGNTTIALTLVTLISVVSLTSIGILLYRQVTKPITEMQVMMTEIATSQDFSHRIPVTRVDEIGQSLIAFNAMIEKIQESSELVKQKTADIQAMLHYIHQGILTVTQGNQVHPEFSAYLETILETNDIAGRSLLELVFSNSNCGTDMLSQIDAACSACIGEDVMNFEFNEHLLAHEIEKKMPDGRVKIIELSWSPITDESGTTVRLMLCLWDVTELRSLAAEANEQKRELAVIGEILAVSQEKFQGFIEGSNQFIAENEQLIRAARGSEAGETDPATVGLLFRNMHTIKGNARTYGLLQLTNLVHEAEQTYDEMRKNPEAAWDHERLSRELSAVATAVAEYARINEVKLGRKGPGRRGGVDLFLMVHKEHVARTLALLDDADASSVISLSEAVRQARNSLQLIGTEKIADVVAGVLDSLPSLAKELGKMPPENSVQDNGIVIKTQIVDMLKNVCMHLYRNAMDHGIESADVRIAQGKPAAGTIALELAIVDHQLELKLRDDGRGLAIEKLKKKALENNLISEDQPLSPESIAQLLFLPGFSTAEHVTEVSGRGVGMDAVKGFVEREGGTIGIALLGQETSDGFRSFETVIRLPENFAVLANV